MLTFLHNPKAKSVEFIVILFVITASAPSPLDTDLYIHEANNGRRNKGSLTQTHTHTKTVYREPGESNEAHSADSVKSSPATAERAHTPDNTQINEFGSAVWHT